MREAREEWNIQVLEALGEPATTSQEPRVLKPVAVGDRVQLPNVSTPGTVTALLADGQVEVAVGRLENAGEQGRSKAPDAGRRYHP